MLPEPPASIAVFAHRTGIPAGQLRRWHARGWLVPDAVDAGSGYRRYAASQLGPGRLLGALIATGMPAGPAARALADSDRGAVLAHLEAVARGVSVIRQHLPLPRGLSVHEGEVPSMPAAVLACRTSVDQLVETVGAVRVLGRSPNAEALVLMEPADDPAVPQDVEIALPWPTDDVPAPFAARLLPARCVCTVDGADDVLAAHQLLDSWLSQEGLIDIGPRRVSVVGDAVTAVSAVVVS